MSEQFTIISLLKGATFESVDVERAFQEQHNRAHSWSAVYLGGLSVMAPVMAMVISWAHSYALTTLLLCLLPIPPLFGVFLIYVSQRCPRWWPHLAWIVAVCQTLLNMHTAFLCHIFSGMGHSNSLENHKSEWLSALLCVQFAWFAYCNIISGYTRWGAFFMLCQPVILLVLILATPSFSLVALYFVPFVLTFAVTSVAISAQMSVLQRRGFWAQYANSLLEMEKVHREHSSVVSHVIKNSLADAVVDIDLLIQSQPERYPAEAFSGIMASLSRGMQWCKNYLMCMKLSKGQVSPSMQVSGGLDVFKFGTDLIAGRRVDGWFSRTTIRTDPVLCAIIMENAVDNARKHGHPTDPQLTCSIAVGDLADDDPEEDVTRLPEVPGPGRHLVEFKVTNRANPDDNPIPSDIVTQVLEKRTEPNSSCPLSDGLGLNHCFLAAQALGMDFGLEQRGDRVTFWARMEADVLPGAAAGGGAAPGAPPAPPFPKGLQVYCIDDSRPMRRWLGHSLRPCGQVHTYGADEGDLLAFVPAALRQADIVVCDQNLDFDGRIFYGTDLVERLLRGGFRGLLCIHSANDSPEDIAKYKASGAHVCISKGMRIGQILDILKDAYLQLPAARQSASDTSPAPSSQVSQTLCETCSDDGSPSGGMSQPLSLVSLLSSPQRRDGQPGGDRPARADAKLHPLCSYGDLSEQPMHERAAIYLPGSSTATVE